MIQSSGDSQLGESDSLLRVCNLKLDFHTYAGEVKALNGVTFAIKRGEALGLVGESGCGKSVTALTIVRLLPDNATVTDGMIALLGRDLLKTPDNEMRKIRAEQVAMVFQDPTTFLNPVLTIGQQLEEVFQLSPERDKAHSEVRHKLTKTSKAERKDLCIEALRQVKLPDPQRILKQYPHELSGGMRQRCMIAMALARNPDLFIADEITTALDVTIQAQILELLRDLKRDFHGSTLLITHDLGVVAKLCSRVAVMYAGNVVELANVRELFAKPLHPYTQGLMKAVPMLGSVGRLETIPGSVPDLIRPPSGCRFHPRCPHALEKCSLVKPELLDTTEGHTVACHLCGEERT